VKPESRSIENQSAGFRYRGVIKKIAVRSSDIGMPKEKKSFNPKGKLKILSAC